MEIIKSILFTSTVFLAQGNFESSMLPGLENCYPNWEGYFERSELVSRAYSDDKEYFLINLYQPNTTSPDPLVISLPVSGGDCTQEFLSITGDDISLSKVLNNVRVARQLTLGLYEKELENLGVEGLQNFINEVAKVNPYWHEENIWALKQLGFSIPENVRAID